MARIIWTQDRILLEIRRLNRRGERLSVRRMRAIGLGGMAAVACRLFGSWRAALDEAGVEPPGPCERIWSLERILDEIRQLDREGRDLSNASVKATHPRLAAAACRNPQLGNWSRALAAAGLDPAQHRQRRNWSRQGIVDEIQARRRRGESLAFSEVRRDRPDLVAAACHEHHFGAWEKAVSAAGFDYDDIRRRRRWTRERILATIKQLHAAGVLLNTNHLREAGHGGLVSAARRRTMFGSWRDAVECAGIDYDQVRREGTRRGRPPKMRAAGDGE